MQTLAHQVLASLRQMILTRELAPGVRLVERDLAERLGVSRTPIREGINGLVREGLVEGTPGLGATVREISTREIHEALLVRRELDALAGRSAAEHATDEDIVAIEAALRLGELAVASGDLARINDADSKFHDAIYQAGRNRVLMNLRDSFGLYESYYFHPDVYRYTAADFRQSLAEHRAIRDAIEDSDPDAAAHWSARNIQQAINLLRLESPAATSLQETAT